MFLANQLNWQDGAPETSTTEVTDWTFQDVGTRKILSRMALGDDPCVVWIERIRLNDALSYQTHMRFNGADNIQPHDTLDAALLHVNNVQAAIQWIWADKAVGHLRSSLHVPLNWQDENGIWAARTPNYYATATEETGTLTIYLQGERMFYRRVAGSSVEEVQRQVQDMLNQKRFEVGQLVEEL